jgi:hypothetical protein
LTRLFSPIWLDKPKGASMSLLITHKKSTNDFYACSLNIHGIYMTFNAKNKIVNKIHFMDEIRIKIIFIGHEFDFIFKIS